MLSASSAHQRHRRLRIPYPTSYPTMSNSTEPEGSNPPAPLGAGERASTPASAPCQPASLQSQPTGPPPLTRPSRPAPPAPPASTRPSPPCRGADHVRALDVKGPLGNSRRTYINPPSRLFKRPSGRSLQDRRSLPRSISERRVVSGEAGYRKPARPLSRAFLHLRDDAPERRRRLLGPPGRSS
jgi:hypothetical protein